MPKRFRSVVVVLLSTFLPTGASAQKMYWVDEGTFDDKIRRANLDGSEVEDLVVALGAPLDVAIDSAAGKMYWTDSETDKIQRANLEIPSGETAENRTDIEDILVGLDDPRGIALDLSILDECELCPGDFDCDNDVDAFDLAALLGAWGPCPEPRETCPADIAGTGDGLVGADDLAVLLGNWGLCE